MNIGRENYSKLYRMGFRKHEQNLAVQAAITKAIGGGWLITAEGLTLNGALLVPTADLKRCITTGQFSQAAPKAAPTPAPEPKAKPVKKEVEVIVKTIPKKKKWFFNEDDNKWECVACGYRLKTEEGIRGHVGAKH